MVAALQVEHVFKSFGGLDVLRDVTFDLEEHEVTCLIGANGAGKTTAFNVVTGFVRPDSGLVRLYGENVSRLRPEQRVGKGMVRTFQLLHLFERMTVLENVEVAVQRDRSHWLRRGGLSASAVEQARSAIELVGLSAHELTWVCNLSYAEQKLVSMAQLIASDAHILLLDEPTSGLDGASLEGVIALIRRMKELGKTVLVVEHNVSLVEEIADTVLFLDQGEIAVTGGPDAVLANPRLAATYLGEVNA